MSQLDFSITFSHFMGFTVCFYVFSHSMVTMLTQFWYNQKVRALTEASTERPVERVENSVFLKRILTL